MLTFSFHQSLMGFFLPLQTDSPFETKQLLGLCHSHIRVRQFLRKYARFLMPLSPSSPHPNHPSPPRFMEMLASYRSWPVVPLFEMCTLFFSLLGNGDRLISPDAHSPGKKGKNIKKEEKAEGVHSFTEHFPPQLTSMLREKLSMWRIWFISILRSVITGTNTTI